MQGVPPQFLLEDSAADPLRPGSPAPHSTRPLASWLGIAALWLVCVLASGFLLPLFTASQLMIVQQQGRSNGDEAEPKHSFAMVQERLYSILLHLEAPEGHVEEFSHEVAPAGKVDEATHTDQQHILDKMSEFDTNKDGALQLSELFSSLGIEDADEAEMDRQYFEALFHDLDTDSDGQLGVLELPALVHTMVALEEQKEQEPAEGDYDEFYDDFVEVET